MILYEAFNLWRQVFLDGRQPAPPADFVLPTWLGYSTGRWDADTLVVDTTGFNGKGWHHDRRPQGVHKAVDDVRGGASTPGDEPMEFICNEHNVVPSAGRP